MFSDFVKRLLFAREFTIINGRNEVLGERQSLIPIQLLIQLGDVNLKMTYNIARNVIKEEMIKFAKKIGTSTPDMITNLKDFYDLLGLGSMEIVSINLITKKATVIIKDNPVALKHLIEKKVVECKLIEGILAGMFAVIFEKECDVEEDKCISKGDAYCEFNIF